MLRWRKEQSVLSSTVLSMPYKDPEKAKECLRRYKASPKGRAMMARARAKYAKTPKGKACQAKYAKSSKGKALTAKYIAKNGEKRKASMAIWNAGWRCKQMPCQVDGCGRTARHLHHLLGYAAEHWFSVIPVCVPCHSQEHP